MVLNLRNNTSRCLGVAGTDTVDAQLRNAQPRDVHVERCAARVNTRLVKGSWRVAGTVSQHLVHLSNLLQALGHDDLERSDENGPIKA